MRVVALADLHSGHRYGLTHPNWFVRRDRDRKLYTVQRTLYDRYHEIMNQVGRPDVVFALGDLIEGPERKNRGIELIEPDQSEQSEMALKLLREWHADRYVLIYGSPYHVGEEEDWEKEIARELDAPIANELYVDVERVTFNLRHTVGRASVPHTVGTALAKEWLIRALLAARQEAPRADVLLRGHVHYHAYVGGPDWLSMALPALCGGPSRYLRRSSGLWSDFGLVVFDVEGDSYTWHAYVARVRSPHVERLKVG